MVHGAEHDIVQIFLPAGGKCLPDGVVRVRSPA